MCVLFLSFVAWTLEYRPEMAQAWEEVVVVELEDDWLQMDSSFGSG